MKNNSKKIMGRVIAIVMAIFLCVGLSGCTNSSSSSNADSNSAINTSEKIKIGMIWYGNTDAMGGTFYSWANHSAEVLGIELIWKLGSYTTADELTDCENLISAGCKGIYFIPMDTSANLQLGNACKEAGVYWSTSNRDIIDDGILKTCETNPYFVNRIYDNSYDVCKEMVKVMADQGIKQVCMLSGDPNDAMMVDRNNGFIDGAEEYGLTILASSLTVSGDATANVDSVSNFLTLYPDMQGILAVSGTAGVGEAIITTLENSNREKGSIKVAAFDTFDGNKEAFESGWLAANCGGYTTECLISFLSLVNRVQGNSISDSNTVSVMTLSPLLITNAEEMDIFSKYVDNTSVQLYSDELIKSLVGPNVTLGDYQKVLDDWSIDYVKSAVGLK